MTRIPLTLCLATLNTYLLPNGDKAICVDRMREYFKLPKTTPVVIDLIIEHRPTEHNVPVRKAFLGFEIGPNGYYETGCREAIRLFNEHQRNGIVYVRFEY